MGCAIWCHFYSVKNSHGGALLLLKLKTKAFTKSNPPPWVFFTFFKLCKWYQIAQRICYCDNRLKREMITKNKKS